MSKNYNPRPVFEVLASALIIAIEKKDWGEIIKIHKQVKDLSQWKQKVLWSVDTSQKEYIINIVENRELGAVQFAIDGAKRV